MNLTKFDLTNKKELFAKPNKVYVKLEDKLHANIQLSCVLFLTDLWTEHN
jgi:hypothetical protein